jgi:hypothetical protein
MNKESRDALRRTQRFLRDDFQVRAVSLHRSSTTALGAARQAMQLSGPQRSARVSQLRDEAEQLRQVDARMATLVAAGAASPDVPALDRVPNQAAAEADPAIRAATPPARTPPPARGEPIRG